VDEEETRARGERRGSDGRRAGEKERRMRMHGRGRRRETSGTMKKAVAVPDLRSRAIFTLVSALLAARLDIPAGSNRGPVY